MNRPLISIVTPSFNQAPFLEQTIQSVLRQEGLGIDFDLEYFVMDGGSTDGSVDIIRRYQSQLAGWCSEPDRGQTHAINKGFERARGDILAYLNSDDAYLPTTLSHVVRAVGQSPECDLFHGVCEKTDAAGTVLSTQLAGISRFTEILDIWEYWLAIPNQNFVQPEVFWTRRLADQIGEFDETLHYAMDFDYWVRCLEAGTKVATIGYPLARFRIHQAQKTTHRDASVCEMLAITERHLMENHDDRLSPADRKRILMHNDLARMMMELDACSNVVKVRQLTKMARWWPELWRSRHFWKHLRRSGRGCIRNAFAPRSEAA